MEETKNKVKEWSIEKDYQEGEKILLDIAENIKKKVSNNEDLPKKDEYLSSFSTPKDVTREERNKRKTFLTKVYSMIGSKLKKLQKVKERTENEDKELEKYQTIVNAFDLVTKGRAKQITMAKVLTFIGNRNKINELNKIIEAANKRVKELKKEDKEKLLEKMKMAGITPEEYADYFN